MQTYIVTHFVQKDMFGDINFGATIIHARSSQEAEGIRLAQLRKVYPRAIKILTSVSDRAVTKDDVL